MDLFEKNGDQTDLLKLDDIDLFDEMDELEKIARDTMFGLLADQNKF